MPQQYSYLSGLNVDAAAKGNAQLRQYLDGLTKQMNAILAGQQTFNTDTGQQNTAPAPVAGDFTVQGQDGNFIIDVTFPEDVLALSQKIKNLNPSSSPNPTGQQMFYELQSADDLAMSVNLKVYDLDSAVHKVINQPNVTKYWQIRWSFDGTSFTSWSYFTSVSVCGPVPVWSGLLRTTSLALLDSQAQTTDGSNALTQHTTTTQIDVAGKTWNVSNQQISYTGGSIDPGSYGSWYVYGIDAQKKGGVITYLATQNIGMLATQDGLIVFGNIVTAGGGGGTGRGGGSCGTTGSLVDMHDGTQKPVEQVRKGDVLSGSDGGPEIAQGDTYPVPGKLCFRLTFANGTIARGLSSPDRVRMQNGGFVTVFDLIVGDVVMTKAGNSALTTKEFIGMQTVYPIQLDRTQTYWIDGVATHNMKTF